MNENSLKCQALSRSTNWNKFLKETFLNDEAIAEFQKIMRKSLEIKDLSQIKELANSLYDEFEKQGLTAEQVIHHVEQLLFAAEKTAFNYHLLRCDISTHLGPITDRFNRNKHTHKFANF